MRSETQERAPLQEETANAEAEDLSAGHQLMKPKVWALSASARLLLLNVFSHQRQGFLSFGCYFML